MKQKLIALVCAFALCLGLAGCTFGTPNTVGSIGGTEISSGLYLLAQYNAYQEALEYANTSQRALSTAKFLQETLPVNENGELVLADGEYDPTTASMKVEDYISAATVKYLQYYAAVETRWAELGGELTAEQLSAAESAAQQLWQNSESAYTANGIGLDTLRAYEYNLYKAHYLTELVYGPEGDHPISDEDLTAYLESEQVYGFYITVPLYWLGSAGYTFADATQAGRAKELLENAAESCETLLKVVSVRDDKEDTSEPAQDGAEADADGAEAEPADTEPAEEAESGEETSSGTTGFSPYSAMYYTLGEYLPQVYEALGQSFDTSTIGSSIYSDLFTADELADYFGENEAATLMALAPGEAHAFAYGETSLVLMLRADPLQDYELDDLRATLLSDLKGDELEAALYAQGAQLPNGLDSSATSRFPAKKIKKSAN